MPIVHQLVEPTAVGIARLTPEISEDIRRTIIRFEGFEANRLVASPQIGIDKIFPKDRLHPDPTNDR